MTVSENRSGRHSASGVYIPWPAAAIIVTLLLAVGGPGVVLAITQARLQEQVGSLAINVNSLSGSVAALTDQVRRGREDAARAEGAGDTWRDAVDRRIQALEQRASAAPRSP